MLLSAAVDHLLATGPQSRGGRTSREINDLPPIEVHGARLPDVINTLAAEATATVPGEVAYTHAPQDALTACIVVVEEGGLASPEE